MTCPPIDHEILDTDEAASFLRLSGRTLEDYRSKKKGPAYSVFGNRVVYLRDDLLAFTRSKRVETYDAI